MKLMLKIAGGIIIAFVLLTAGCAALVGTAANQASKDAAKHPSFAKAASSPLKVSGDDQAQKSAQSYLDGPSAFSRSGLIEQLKFEGFSKAEATSAVDSLSVNWNEQAAKSAQSYLDGPSAFSRSGLIEQLEFEGFSRAQAAYGVGQVYG